MYVKYECAMRICTFVLGVEGRGHLLAHIQLSNYQAIQLPNYVSNYQTTKLSNYLAIKLSNYKTIVEERNSRHGSGGFSPERGGGSRQCDSDPSPVNFL